MAGACAQPRGIRWHPPEEEGKVIPGKGNETSKGRAGPMGHQEHSWSGQCGERLEGWNRRLVQVGKAWSTILRGCSHVRGENDVDMVLNLGRWWWWCRNNDNDS